MPEDPELAKLKRKLARIRKERGTAKEPKRKLDQLKKYLVQATTSLKLNKVAAAKKYYEKAQLTSAQLGIDAQSYYPRLLKIHTKINAWDQAQAKKQLQKEHAAKKKKEQQKLAAKNKKEQQKKRGALLKQRAKQDVAAKRGQTAVQKQDKFEKQTPVKQTRKEFFKKVKALAVKPGSKKDKERNGKSSAKKGKKSKLSKKSTAAASTSKEQGSYQPPKHKLPLVKRRPKPIKDAKLVALSTHISEASRLLKKKQLRKAERKYRVVYRHYHKIGLPAEVFYQDIIGLYKKISLARFAELKKKTR